MANRDELALLLGHELSHLLLLHPRDTGLLALLNKVVALGGTAYSNYALFKNTEVHGEQVTVKADEDALLRAIGANAASSSLMLDILMPGRDRKREIEADQLGIDLAWRSGFRLKATDIEAFTKKNDEDNHELSDRMQRMRSVLLIVITKATAKLTKTATGMLGSVGAYLTPLAMVGSDVAARQMFESLANSRKRHIDPEQRRLALTDYFDQNVAGQPFDAATEPVIRRAKAAPGRARVAAAATGQAQAFIASALWARKWEDVSMAALGESLTQEAARARENGGSSFLGKLRSAAGVDKKMATLNTNTAPATATGVVAQDTAAEARASLMARLAALAQDLGRPGLIKPAVVNSSTGAGMIAALVLKQELRGQGFWSAGAQGGYPVAELYRNLGASYSRSHGHARLPALVSQYKDKIGTVDPVLDLAVGGAVAEGKVGEAAFTAAAATVGIKGLMAASRGEGLK